MAEYYAVSAVLLAGFAVLFDGGKPIFTALCKIAIAAIAVLGAALFVVSQGWLA